MNKYNHLSQENRDQIKALLDAGHNQTEIAETIGVDKSAISRELKRNVANTRTTGNNYQTETAQKLTDRRWQAQARKPVRQQRQNNRAHLNH